MMSAKLKFLIVLLVSLFATSAVGAYFIHTQLKTSHSDLANGKKPQPTVTNRAVDVTVNPERANYRPIPLEDITSILEGTSPTDLALGAFDNVELVKGTRIVEVAYPEPNQAVVKITQTQKQPDLVRAIRYRVELSTFGRSLLVSSPRVWQVVWVGSQEQCDSGSSKQKKSIQRC